MPILVLVEHVEHMEQSLLVLILVLMEHEEHMGQFLSCSSLL
jgi:hypothetical protein